MSRRLPDYVLLKVRHQFEFECVARFDIELTSAATQFAVTAFIYHHLQRSARAALLKLLSDAALLLRLLRHLPHARLGMRLDRRPLGSRSF